MSNEPSEFCPSCGAELRPVDPPTAHHCSACGEQVFYTPIPTARLAVLDGDSVLFVKVRDADRDRWGTPGGMVEAGEDPDATGARELREVTGLAVDPAALVLFDARTFVKFEQTHKTSIACAVDAADASGTPRPGDEAAEVRFRSPADLAAADDRLLASWPEAHSDLAWWVENARAALERTRR